MNNVSLCLSKLEKEEQTNPKASKRKKKMKIGLEMNEIENQKMTEGKKIGKFNVNKMSSLKRFKKMTF